MQQILIGFAVAFVNTMYVSQTHQCCEHVFNGFRMPVCGHCKCVLALGIDRDAGQISEVEAALSAGPAASGAVKSVFGIQNDFPFILKHLLLCDSHSS